MKNGPVGPPQQLPLFADIMIHAANIQVGDSPDGKKLLRFLMPNGLAVTILLDNTGVEALITQLKGTNITVARGLG
jgi:hypothetical protein